MGIICFKLIHQEKIHSLCSLIVGDWVTVVSSKDKKAKQAQIAAVETEQLSEQAKQVTTIIYLQRVNYVQYYLHLLVIIGWLKNSITYTRIPCL